MWFFCVFEMSVAGRYCEWEQNTIDMSSKINTFEEYMHTLHLACQPGDSAVLNWTVAAHTPDLVYYQVHINFSRVKFVFFFMRSCFISDSGDIKHGI